jgi:hypothetical protein
MAKQISEITKRDLREVLAKIKWRGAAQQRGVLR